MTGGDTTAKRELIEQMVRLTRGFHHMKARLANQRPDRAAYNVLFPLLDGDKRAADLADMVHSDPSTVSRHIAHLVSNGLAQRVPDQADGRAALVSVTGKGREFCDLMKSQRESRMAKLLEQWSDEDAQQFAVLMRRFNDDIEAALPSMIQGMQEAYDTVETPTESSPSDKETA